MRFAFFTVGILLMIGFCVIDHSYQSLGGKIFVQSLVLVWVLGLFHRGIEMRLEYIERKLDGGKDTSGGTMQDTEARPANQLQPVPWQLDRIVKQLDRIEHEQGILHEHLQEISKRDRP